jgi:hypothetical protein
LTITGATRIPDKNPTHILAVNLQNCNIASPSSARMAELVDAPDSKSGIRKDVQVRFLFRALTTLKVVFLFVTSLSKLHFLAECKTSTAQAHLTRLDR